MKKIFLQDLFNAGQVDHQTQISLLGVDKDLPIESLRIQDLRLDQLTRIADFFECTVETFFLSAHRQTEEVLEIVKPKKVLPFRYREGSMSKMRTTQSALEFVSRTMGDPMVRHLVRTLRVPVGVLTEAETLVSMRLISDVSELLFRWNASSEYLYQMGLFSYEANRGSAVETFFQDCREPKEVYEKLIPILGVFFEKNHIYRLLKLTRQEVWIEAKLNPELIEIYKGEKVGGRAACELRRGVAGSFARFGGGAPLHVEHPKCIHQGDSCCVFRVHFTARTREV